MTNTSMDPIKLALQHVTCLEDAVKNTNITIERGETGLRTRARNVPELIAQAGLVPTLILLLSKLSDQTKKPETNLSNALKIINCINTGTRNDNEIRRLLQNDLKKGEKRGYYLYTAILLDALYKLANLKLYTNIDDKNLIKTIINNLQRYYSNQPNKILTAELALRDYLLHLKRLVEAIY